MADNALTKLSLAGQLGVSLAVAVLIGGLFYWRWLSPAFEERDTKTARLEALQKEIRALEVTANKLAEFEREVALLEAKLETLKRILPPAKETPDLMRKVQSLAAQSNLTIRTFTPTATVNKEFYQEWPINVAVDGSYHNLGMFFDRVRQLERLVNVGNLKIQNLNTHTATNPINATCVATTFDYQETPPPGAAPPGGPPRPGAPPAAGAPR
jgi:type IV pilus assembly protein PilO